MDEALEVLRAEDTADSVMMDLAKRAGLTFKFFSFQYLSRLFASVTFCFVAAYVNTLASVCAGYRTPWLSVRDLDGKETSMRTLPDLGHDLVEIVATQMGAKTKYVDNYALPDELVVLWPDRTERSHHVYLFGRRLLLSQRGNLTTHFSCACHTVRSVCRDACPHCVAPATLHDLAASASLVRDHVLAARRDRQRHTAPRRLTHVPGPVRGSEARSVQAPAHVP